MKKTANKFRKKLATFPKGFTLIEIIVTISIFLLVVGGFTAIFIFSFRSRAVIMEQLLTQTEGRRIVQDFVNELRSATQSSIGAYAIEKAENNQIIFFSNIDTDSYRERVRYFLDGTNFKRGITKPSGNPMVYNTSTESAVIIAHDVINPTTTPIFKYYDQAYTGSQASLTMPVSITQIRIVAVHLIMEEDPNLSPAPFVVQAKAEIRNLKGN
ncbi:MAG: prepilin-type N-terminal cleavage/methylation domain-containing protein [Candidatus Magasanikbacteria bacterium]|nr:prepilin-type N-terminal cleavage/methylation domain-containing protein [Candidatus Magasanikbacteria bacterium]